MSQASDADEAAEKRLCDACVEDSYLRDEIKRQNEVSKCSYCGKQRPTISIGDLAEKCNRVFETYYERTPSEPEGIDAIAHNDPEGGYSWERQGDPPQDLISEFARIDEEPAQDVRLVLEEQHNSFDDWGEEQESEKRLATQTKLFLANRCTSDGWSLKSLSEPKRASSIRLRASCSRISSLE